VTIGISGFIVKGKIENGNYSRKEMLKMEEELSNGAMHLTPPHTTCCGLR
jgi:hypothetical protein